MMPVIPHFSNECLEIIKYKKILNGQNMIKKIFKEDKIKYCNSNKWKKRGLIKTKTRYLKNDLIEINK